ncbi:MAG TPA: glycosyltransferase family 39 protein, partial [Mycobacteriales bacterium]|nr:glycosyltransferase family 39 protein [Mycobacteriales bacterium]
MVESAEPVAAGDPRSQPTLALPRWVTAALAAVLVAAVVLRLLALSPLWLDEAQSVEIARRSVSGLLSALRHDGSPPAYYLLLHGWMTLFGTSSLAVRALSGVFSVAALPLMWLAARRVGASTREAWVATVLLATNPFAVRYATETRMYSLVIVLWLVAFLVYRRVWLTGGIGWMVSATLVTGAMVLTHYWSLFLVATAGLAALAVVRRQPAPAGRVLGCLAVGCLALVPWLPSMLFQMRHTGAPWGSPPSLATPIEAPNPWAGAGPVGTSDALSFCYYVLIVLALVGTATATGVLVGSRVRPAPARLLAVAFTTMFIGCLVNIVLGSAYASR